MSILRITDETTRDELAEALAHLCAEAKAMSRRGYVGTQCEEYAHWHQRINAVLTDMDAVARQG